MIAIDAAFELRDYYAARAEVDSSSGQVTSRRKRPGELSVLGACNGRVDTTAGRTLARIPDRTLAEGDQRPRFHPAELPAVRRRRRLSRAGDRAHAEDLEDARALFVEERKKGVLDVSQIPSSITAHAPGYIDKDNEIIVGLQTEAPLKRAIMPNGGFRMVASALKTYGYEPDPARRRGLHEISQDAQRGGVRRVHGRRPQVAAAPTC